VSASVTGGSANIADAPAASISGGQANAAIGNYSSISGGRRILQSDFFGWAAGGNYGGLFPGPGVFHSP
jgi:hypothetical protein